MIGIKTMVASCREGKKYIANEVVCYFVHDINNFVCSLRVRGQHTKTTGRRGRTVGVSKKKG